MKAIKNVINEIAWRIRHAAITSRFCAKGPRIIYALTPPPKLSNLGDHAQVVAIYGWLSRHFPEYEVIELDKDEVIHSASSLKYLVKQDDIIILHSGGNLGDRGIWSEAGRRLMIQNFPENKIISLPQTIFFSQTPRGIEELEKSRAIYNNHPNLVIIARDSYSYELAKNYFVLCTIDKAPDFVLSYNHRPEIFPPNGRALYCLREDNESAISEEQRQMLIDGCPIPCDIFDTTIMEHIGRSERKKLFDNTLAVFSQYEYVVTDRFHGLIFSVLCNKPTIVLPTVDHKLTSAFDWFEKVEFVKFASTVSDVPFEIEKARSATDRSVPDWNEIYFDALANHIRNVTV